MWYFLPILLLFSAQPVIAQKAQKKSAPKVFLLINPQEELSPCELPLGGWFTSKKIHYEVFKEIKKVRRLDSNENVLQCYDDIFLYTFGYTEDGQELQSINSYVVCKSSRQMKEIFDQLLLIGYKYFKQDYENSNDNEVIFYSSCRNFTVYYSVTRSKYEDNAVCWQIRRK